MTNQSENKVEHCHSWNKLKVWNFDQSLFLQMDQTWAVSHQVNPIFADKEIFNLVAKGVKRISKVRGQIINSGFPTKEEYGLISVLRDWS